MGGRFASRLMAAGFDLIAYDARPEVVEEFAAGGARAATSVRDVADGAATVLVSLPSPDTVHEVACGADGLRAGSTIRTYVDLSTTGAAMAERVAAHLSARGIRCVDAPVSGGPLGAETGTLTVIAAGDADALELVRPLLEAIGSRLIVVGNHPGQAQLVKLINNLLSAGAIAITGEALCLAAKAGLDPKLVLDVVNVSSGANNAAVDKFPKQVLTRSFNHGFRLALMAKDVRLCLGEASRHGVPMTVGNVIDQVWERAEASLEPGVDCTAIVRMFEQSAGTVIADRVPRTPSDQHDD